MSKGLLQRPIEIRGKSVDLNGGGSAPALLGVVEADESWQSLSHLFFPVVFSCEPDISICSPQMGLLQQFS